MKAVSFRVIIAICVFCFASGSIAGRWKCFERCSWKRISQKAKALICCSSYASVDDNSYDDATELADLSDPSAASYQAFEEAADRQPRQQQMPLDSPPASPLPSPKAGLNAQLRMADPAPLQPDLSVKPPDLPALPTGACVAVGDASEDLGELIEAADASSPKSKTCSKQDPAPDEEDYDDCAIVSDGEGS